jgi:hypothetical protein
MFNIHMLVASYKKRQAASGALSVFTNQEPHAKVFLTMFKSISTMGKGCPEFLAECATKV